MSASHDHATDGTQCEQDAEVDSLSEGSEQSDLSDMFHVAALDSSCRPVLTEEDRELERIDSLAEYLRERPLLPPHPSGEDRAYEDIEAGVALPKLHCAVRGCRWVRDSEQSTYEELYQHVRDSHTDMFLNALGKCVPKSEWGDYYEEAIKVQERKQVPLLGPSVDRRTFQHLRDLYNDEKLLCLICVACAQKFVYRAGVLQSGAIGNVGDISICTGADFGRLPPGQIFKNFSMARFSELYAFPPSQPPEGCGGAHSTSPLHGVPDLADDNWEWRRLLQVPGLEEQVIICCPEDVTRSEACGDHAAHIICQHCCLPVCSGCWGHLQNHLVEALSHPYVLFAFMCEGAR